MVTGNSRLTGLCASGEPDPASTASIPMLESTISRGSARVTGGTRTGRGGVGGGGGSPAAAMP
ncbi:hypothetical protein MFAL_20560 [Mycolicibacterium fallax]|nr:hypothetical protein MFAL_20560 [Mycolicibacterium fallax]